MAGTVKVDVRNRIALVTLDRPDSFNSFDKNTLKCGWRFEMDNIPGD